MRKGTYSLCADLEVRVSLGLDGAGSVGLLLEDLLRDTASIIKPGVL
jgi:hypothetical protein